MVLKKKYACISVGAQPVWNLIDWDGLPLKLMVQVRRALHKNVYVVQIDPCDDEAIQQLCLCRDAWIRRRRGPLISFLLKIPLDFFLDRRRVWCAFIEKKCWDLRLQFPENREFC